jgi:hypothetical protein
MPERREGTRSISEELTFGSDAKRDELRKGLDRAALGAERPGHLANCFVGREARHEVDRNGRVRAFCDRLDVSKLQLEERLPVEHFNRRFDNPAKPSRHTAGQDHRGDFAPPHGFLAAIAEGPPHVAPERGKSLQIALLGGFHLPGNAVLGCSKPALGETLLQRIKRNIVKSVPLKKLCGVCVYFS